MSMRKVKAAPKVFLSDKAKIRELVQTTMREVADIVGGTLGPSGRLVSIESDFIGIPNKVTKDGVSVFKALGKRDPFKQLIIEQARDAAEKTATEAGDGTTSASILSSALIDAMYAFCDKNKKYSPQRAAREMTKLIRDILVPTIKSRSITIGEDNLNRLYQVAKTSANGDDDIASAVIKAFELIGFGDSTHITIKEAPGPYGFNVSAIEGFPFPIGYQDSCGKFYTAFITDQGNQRCVMEKPAFLLYDGTLNDLANIQDFLGRHGAEYAAGNADYKNLVIVAHGFGEQLLLQLAVNFTNPDSINILPLKTPMAPFANGQTEFLMDLAAFTGAKMFGMKDPVNDAQFSDLGSGMEKIETYRFRSTVVGNPDPVNVEVRADDLNRQSSQASSEAEKRYLTERVGKLTSGIAKIEISAGSSGEIKEIFDRVEDAVLATRSAISKGVLPGGSRALLDLCIEISTDKDSSAVAKEVVVSALMAPITRLLENSGHTDEEIQEIIDKLVEDKNLIYNVADFKFESVDETSVFDATSAVVESLLNASSIAATLGTLGGIVVHPRDDAFERAEASADREFMDAVENPMGGRFMRDEPL